jgi:hypothetical protein
MRRPITRLWSAEDDAALRRLATAGASKVRIAAALGRLPDAVRVRAKMLGVTLKRMPPFRYDFQRRDRRRDRQQPAL